MEEIFGVVKTLRDLSIEDIDERIAWLEEALAAYRAIRAVVSIMHRKPTGITVPSNWKSAVDLDNEREQESEPEPEPEQELDEEVKGHRDGRCDKNLSTKNLVVRFLADHGPATKRQIAAEIGKSDTNVSCTLSGFKDILFCKLGEGRWGLINADVSVGANGCGDTPIATLDRIRQYLSNRDSAKAGEIAEDIGVNDTYVAMVIESHDGDLFGRLSDGSWSLVRS